MIPIIIPIGYDYECTVSGSTFNIVQCEYCRFIYVYRMTREGQGAAAFEVEQKLRYDYDAVPCLECGKYQAHMVAALKRDFQHERVFAAKTCFILAGLAGLFGLISLLWDHLPERTTSWLAAAVFVFIALGLFQVFVRNRSLNRFEPNSTDLADRMKIAAKYAKSLDEFRAYLRQIGIEWDLPQHPEAT
jgi:hypothetical protein